MTGLNYLGLYDCLELKVHCVICPTQPVTYRLATFRVYALGTTSERVNY